MVDDFQKDQFIHRRMVGPAAWLYSPPVVTKETGEMAKLCSVTGCERQAQGGKDGMCCVHWREKTGTPMKVRGVDVLGKAGVLVPVKSDSVSVHPPAVASSVKDHPAPLRRGLLVSLAAPDARPGFFVDFTGYEELLEQVGPVCPELNEEIMALLAAVVSGRLAWRV